MKTSQITTTFFFFLVLFTSSIHLKTASSADTEEAETLLKWKDTFVSPPSTLKTTWSTNNSKKLCSWHGVACNTNRRVSGINLTGLKMKGTLQTLDFASLPKLEVFDLHNNFFSGACRAWGSFDVSYNQLSGEIPEALGSLRSLWYIDLSNNSLTGQIPSSFGNLSRLETLYMSGNGLSGPIPEGLSKIESLVYIVFSYNDLSGLVPTGGVFDKVPNNAFTENKKICGESKAGVAAPAGCS